MMVMFRRVHRDERGITFVELLIALGVAGIISAAIVGTIFQVATLNTRASNHMIAVRQVQQAGKEISTDVFQSRTIQPASGESQSPPGSGFPLILKWTDLDRHQNVVQYSVNGRDELERKHTTYDGGAHPKTATTIVARHIDTCSDKTYLSMRLSDDNKTVLVLTVTATIGHHSETRVYEVKPRPHQETEPSG